MKHSFLLATLLTLGGCTMQYADPTLSADNPASPSAAESPLPPGSTALSLAAEEPTRVSTTSADRSGNAMHDMNKRRDSAPRAETAQSEPAAPPSAASKSPASYVCPMHPEVTSEKPDQRCPKCGMKLKLSTDIEPTQKGAK